MCVLGRGEENTNGDEADTFPDGSANITLPDMIHTHTHTHTNLRKCITGLRLNPSRAVMISKDI